MIAFTNTQPQTLQPGDAALLPVTYYGGTCCNANQQKIRRSGDYKVSFHGNIGATAPGAAELTLQVGGINQPTTVMKANTAAAGDLQSVGCELPLSMGCCRIGAGLNAIAVVNTGETELTIDANPSLIVEGE